MKIGPTVVPPHPGLADQFISGRGHPILIANRFYPGSIAYVIVAKCSWQFFGYVRAFRVIPVVKVNVHGSC